MRLGKFIDFIEPSLPSIMKLYIQYYRVYHRIPNFFSPKTYTEKLYFRMINPLPIFSYFADKIEVRNYVKSVLGPEYLVPAHGVYDHITPDDIEALPDSFVLKANHGAGYNIIVANKREESLEDIAYKANKFLELDYSKLYHEKHYKNIKPKLICEKALLKEGKAPADYKVHVFNNTEDEDPFIFIQLMTRYGKELSHFYLLEDWSPAPFRLVKQGVDPLSNPGVLEKPKMLGELVDAAKKLAKPFSYARIDFYIFEGRIYFGEITLTPGGGFVLLSPEKWDLKLGEKFGWPDAYKKIA